MKSKLRAFSLLIFILFAQSYKGQNEKSESVIFKFPREDWEIAGTVDSAGVRIVHLVHPNEGHEKWTEHCTIVYYETSPNYVADRLLMEMDGMYSTEKTYCPEATLTFIEEKQLTEHPCIIFTLENLKEENLIYSKIVYGILGRKKHYFAVVILNTPSVSRSAIKKWSKIFSTAKIVQEDILPFQ